MNQCGPERHRLEFVEASHGENVWLCLECGETIMEYQNGDGA